MVDFLEAYVASLLVEKVDEKAERAKALAIAALQTDIDILVFVDPLRQDPGCVPWSSDAAGHCRQHRRDQPCGSTAGTRRHA
jgi:hypothetical protein